MLVRHGIRDPGAVDDTMSLVFDHLRRLPRRERLVCDLLLDGRSQAEIAGRLGRCAGTMPRIRQRALKVLRDVIAVP